MLVHQDAVYDRHVSHFLSLFLQINDTLALLVYPRLSRNHLNRRLSGVPAACNADGRWSLHFEVRCASLVHVRCPTH